MNARVVLAMCMGSILLAGASSSAPEDAVPGTYELLVCKGPCGFDAPTNVVVKGVLVLARESFTLGALNAFTPEPFEEAYSFAREPNGCFVVKTLTANQTYAGIIERGVTVWSLNDGRLHIPLCASSDAWHVVNAAMTCIGFAGSGSSGGVGAAEPNTGPDNILARRIGDASLGECVSAAIKQSRKGRGAV
jgi:hypothetical protein